MKVLITDAYRRALARLEAPYRELLEVDPLWVTVDNGWGAHVVTAHATVACAEVPAHLTELPPLDLDLVLVENGGSVRLLLCECTVLFGGSSLESAWVHPVRQLYNLAPHLARLMVMGARTDILDAEGALASVARHVRSATRRVAGRPELAFWQEWLERSLAMSTRRVDALRATRLGIRPIFTGADDVFMSVSVLAIAERDMLDVLSHPLAQPVQARVVEDWAFVVRVPREDASAAARLGDGIQALGSVRPMTTEAWGLYEQLRVAQYSPTDAYTAAADSVGQLDKDTVSLLDPLIAAGVPVADLISTALELAR